MSPERWRQAEALYDSAFERDPESRASYLAQACNGDDELRRLVESLIEKGETPDSPLEKPLDPPGRFGPYSIVGKLGAGGMGEVYKAYDQRLNRTVAVKVLKSAFSDRIQREARAIAALNHPHICTLHDIGDGYLVMEYVEGAPLKGPLGLDQALEYAAQICDALDAAHQAGIVHRDLKPANILVTKRGIKLLDFGIARMMEGGDTFTGEGAVLGTPAYMAPEVLKGQPADARSDIYSLGCVLREVVTGSRAVPGKLEPPGLERVVRTCLADNPEERWQSAREMKLALESVREPDAEQPATRRPWLVWAVASLAVASGVAYFVLRPSSDPASLPQEISFTKLTDQAGSETHPSLSPDSRSFLYAARGDIHLQRIGGKNPVNLTKDSPAGDMQPVFSPDGEQIAFRSERDGGGIFVMGATGESVRRLSDFGFNPAWSPDGKDIVFSVAQWVVPTARASLDSRLWVVNVSTGQKRQLTKPDRVPDAVQPNWSPNGHRIAYWAVSGGQRDIWTVSADGANPAPITEDAAVDWSPVWSPDGSHLYFASDRGGSMNLWRVGVDEKSGRVLGRPAPLTTPSPYSGYISISRDGKRVAYVHQLTTANIQKAEFDPVKEAVVSPPQWITQGSREATAPNVSADGEWLTFMERRGKQDDIFVVGTDGTGLRQLTNDVYGDRYPRWSPNGKRIAFYSSRSGKSQIWLMNPDGSGLEQLTYASAPGAISPIWSPDGKHLAYAIPDATPFVLEVSKRWKDQSPKPLVVPPELGMHFEAWSWSPDGRKLAGEFRKPDGGPQGLGIYHLESGKLESLRPSGIRPAWLRDSRRLLFQDQGKLYLIDTQNKKPREILSAAPYTLGQPALSSDDRLIYVSVFSIESDIWLAALE